jgi:hypothetical protein
MSVARQRQEVTTDTCQGYSQDLQILQTLDRSLVDTRQFVVVELPAKRDTGVISNKT